MFFRQHICVVRILTTDVDPSAPDLLTDEVLTASIGFDVEFESSQTTKAQTTNGCQTNARIEEEATAAQGFQNIQYARV